MAYNDSGVLPVSQMYGLGEYVFELKVQTVHEPGEEDVVSVYAICREFGGTTRETQAVDFPIDTVVEGWYVEANETEATVYVKTANSALPIAPVGASSGTLTTRRGVVESFIISGTGEITFIPISGDNYRGVYGSSQEGTTVQYTNTEGVSNTLPLSSLYKRDGKTVYYFTGTGVIPPYTDATPKSSGELSSYSAGRIAWALVYGNDAGESEMLVGRFAIDLADANGGPGGDWDEPGDDGPPGTTLSLTVTGATAGSCTGTPADNEIVKGYGDGGDGGYGGGGGAGASTVIIYEFATDIADSVQQEAISRGPGTGGPGGKGGKGGDGCILIFY